MDQRLFCLVLMGVLAAVIAQTLPPPFEQKCVRGTYPPKNRPQVPTFKVNLDLAPEQRWNEVIKNKGPQMAGLLKQFKQFLLNFSNSTQFVIDLVDNDLGWLVETLPSPYKEEMKGISLQSGLPLGEVFLYNVFYEVFTVCTSLVAEDPSGKLIHARNLDFGLFLGWNPVNHTWKITEALRPLIVNLNFVKGGKTVYKSVNFAGYIGLLTAIKPGIFTYSMDERFNVNGGYIGILKWIIGERNQKWMGFLSREVLETANSYSEAKSRLSDTPMLAPAYFILGGNKSGEGCVITRDRDRAVDVWNMSDTEDKWYILETNYDHWKKPLFLDDRRTPAHNCMRKLTQQNVNFGGIFDVLSSKPVLNKLTTYTALMQVNSGQLETYLQYCDDKTCFPW